MVAEKSWIISSRLYLWRTAKKKIIKLLIPSYKLGYFLKHNENSKVLGFQTLTKKNATHGGLIMFLLKFEKLFLFF